MNTQDSDPIGRLLNDVPPRAVPDPADAEAVYRAVRAEWQQAHPAPRHRRWAPMALAASISLAALVAWWLAGPPAPGVVYQVARLDGRVEQWQSDAWQPVETTLVAGSRLRTGPEGGLALTGPAGTELRIDAASEVVLGETLMRLEQGALYLDVKPGAPAGIGVEAGSVRVEHIGTRFAVRREDRVDVMVRDGRVAVEDDAQRVELGTGEAVSAFAGSVGTPRGLAVYAPEWNWVQDIAPGYDLNGRSVADFLDWVASETGLAVHFQDSATERASRSTILSGALHGISARDALEPVLSATRFRHQWQDGRILILAAP